MSLLKTWVSGNSGTPDLSVDASGIFYFEQTVGATYYAPLMVIVGYDLEWKDMDRVVPQPTGNSLQLTIKEDEVFTSPGSGLSINQGMLQAGSDHFVYIEVNKPINNLGANINNLDQLKVAWKLASNNTGAYMTITNDGAQYEATGPSGTSYNLSDGDNLLMTIDGGDGTVVFKINGITKWTSQAQPTYSGSSRIIGYVQKHYNSNHPSNLTSTLYNVITSLPCPELVHTQLKRELDGSYYWANTNKVAFQYIEEYEDADQSVSVRKLNYNIIDGAGTVIMSSSNSSDPEIEKSYGDNRFALSVIGLNAGFYTLEVYSEKGELLKLRFKKD